MHEYNGQAHHASAPVSALMDTAFVRSAAMDANDERRAERGAPSELRLRWVGAIRALAVALRRH